MSMERGTKRAVVAGVMLAGALTFGYDRYTSDNSKNVPPSDTCEEFGYKTADDPEQITIESGETVSEKVAAPLAQELGTTATIAMEMLVDANPAIPNLGKVAAGLAINSPNCQPN